MNLRIFWTIRIVVLGSLFLHIALLPFYLEHETPYSSDIVNHYNAYVRAELYITQKKPVDAIELLSKLIKDNHSAASSFFIEHAIVRALSTAERFQEVVVRNKDLLKDNLESQILFADAYAQVGKTAEAEALLKSLYKMNPENDELLLHLISFFQSQNKTAKALEYLNQHIGQKMLNPRHAFFYYIAAKFYIELKQEAQALQVLQKCIELNSSMDKAWHLKAMLHQALNQEDQAIKAFKVCLDLNSDQPTVRRQLVSLYFSKGHFKEASEELKKNPENNEQYFFDIAMLEWKAQDHKECLAYLKKARACNFNYVKARVLEIELLLQTKQFSDALKRVSEWLSDEPTSTLALSSVVSLYNNGLDVATLIKLLRPLYETTKSRNSAVILADFYCADEKYAESLALYKTISKSIHDQVLLSKVFFQIGYLNFRLNKVDKVEKHLLASLKCDSQYAPSNNLLAYCYAMKNNKLNEALMLVEKALKENGKNSSFLDTKGYILYKLGRSREAHSFLKKALQVAPHNKLIVEHLTMLQKNI